MSSLRELSSKYFHSKLERKELIKTFEEKRNYILNLPDNWDGYGAQPFNEGTLNRAYSLIENILSHFWFIIGISIPLIQPVADSSIDITWETDQFELLINISHLKPPEQLEQLQLSFESWKGNLEQIDDILVMGIRI